MNCRICGASEVVSLAKFSPYIDFSTEIYDCNNCGCRFSSRDDDIYERLHSSPTSTYSRHEKIANNILAYFAQDNASELERELGSDFKNKFIIDSSKSIVEEARILEVGCSRGYLTSYFIKNNYKVLGVDLSLSAINHAKKLFGDYFCLPDDPRITRDGDYDFIYHVGTIGCVEDPISFTKHWLSLLKPGGTLVFNAPNKKLADILEHVWPYTTPPPDLVTVFPACFWGDVFGRDYKVSVEERLMTKELSLSHKIIPAGLFRSKLYLFKENKAINLMSRLVYYFLRVLSKIIAKFISVTLLPSESGVMVRITKPVIWSGNDV